MTNSNSDLIKVDKAEIEQLLQQKPELDREGAYKLIYDRKEREFEEHGELPDVREVLKKEQQEIEQHLKKPELLVETIKEVQKEVAGEEDTIAAITIVATTRLVDNAIPESTNLLLSDKTGLGKDHVTGKTLDVIIPESQHLHVTKMTPESFTYWHYKEEGWTWNHKCIHFEDITQKLLNCSTFKVMASGDNYAVVVKDQKTIEIPIIGKPCMILTSHHANPKDEALRRFRIGALNDTKEQTKRIKEKISRRYAGLEKITENIALKKAIQQLKPYPVKIPYARLIQHFFPDDTLMRTHYHCFLDYICASAVFHQEQREKTPNGELIATPDDYMIARMVLIYTTSNPKMIPMSKEYRDLLKILELNREPMKVKDIDLQFDKSKKWLYKHLPNLVELGLLKKGEDIQEVTNKDGKLITKQSTRTFQYAPELNTQTIPTWNEIIAKIKSIEEKVENKENTLILSTEEKQLYEGHFPPSKIKKIPSNDAKKEKGNGGYFPHGKNPWGINYKEKPERVFSAFSRFSSFLRERDNRRYKKYYYNQPKDTIEDLIRWLKEKPYEEYVSEHEQELDDDPNFPFSFTTLYEAQQKGIIEPMHRSDCVTLVPDDERKSFLENQEKVKKIIEEKPDNNYELVESACGSSFIEESLKRGILEEPSLGTTLKWVGGN